MGRNKAFNPNNQYIFVVGGLLLVFIVLLVLSVFTFSNSLYSILGEVGEACFSSVNCMLELEQTYHSQTVIFAVILVMLALCGIACFLVFFVSKIKLAGKSGSDLLTLTNTVTSGIVKVQKSKDTYYIQYANEGFYRLLGYSRKEYKSKFKNELFGCAYHKDVEEVLAILQKHEAKERLNLEFRIENSFQKVRWLLMSVVKKEQYYFCSFTDITCFKAIEDELQLNNDRLHVVLEKMKDMIFEYNLMSKELLPIANMEQFDCVTRYCDLLDLEIMEESDINQLKKMIESAKAGEKQQTIRFKIKDKNGNRIWSELHLTTLFDTTDTPCRILGRISNVDMQVKEKQQLIEISQRDAMTSLLNKSVAQEKIEEFMAGSDGKGAMLLLDIDNFKQINDTYGHIIGDQVIKYFALQLTKLFRQYDIVSRLGGDEFLIFMKFCDDERLIREKIEDMRKMMAQFQLADGRQGLSFSLGIALFDKDGTTYTEVLENADLAMYVGKRNGKGRYEFYNSAMRDIA